MHIFFMCVFGGGGGGGGGGGLGVYNLSSEKTDFVEIKLLFLVCTCMLGMDVLLV